MKIYPQYIKCFWLQPKHQLVIAEVYSSPRMRKKETDTFFVDLALRDVSKSPMKFHNTSLQLHQPLVHESEAAIKHIRSEWVCIPFIAHYHREEKCEYKIDEKGRDYLSLKDGHRMLFWFELSDRIVREDTKFFNRKKSDRFPIYRAKSKDSDEEEIVQYLGYLRFGMEILQNNGAPTYHKIKVEWNFSNKKPKLDVMQNPGKGEFKDLKIFPKIFGCGQ